MEILRISRQIDDVFWIWFWLFLLWNVAKLIFSPWLKEEEPLSKREVVSFLLGSISAGMYFLQYFYIKILGVLLGGHSVYFHFFYSIAAIALALFAFALAILSKGSFKYPSFIVSLVMLFEFSNELGIIPYPVVIWEFALFTGITLLQMGLLLREKFIGQTKSRTRARLYEGERKEGD